MIFPGSSIGIFRSTNRNDWPRHLCFLDNKPLIIREFDVRIKSVVCLRKSATVKTGNLRFAGCPANTKTENLMLAGCPANAKTENLMLAGRPANAKTENLMLAGLPQTPKLRI